jgi:hypothetical protein
MKKPEYGPPKRCLVAEEPPTSGSFFSDDAPHWFRCRELFAGYFSPDTKLIYFSFSCAKESSVPHFIATTEEVLNLSRKTPMKSTVFHHVTNKKNVWAIDPSPFWRHCPMRRSLFTILLRSGRFYDTHQNNWEESLYSDEYIKTTKNASMRFMYGFNYYVMHPGDRSGWCVTFKNSTNEEVKKRLTFPRELDDHLEMVGSGTLWG